MCVRKVTHMHSHQSGIVLSWTQIGATIAFSLPELITCSVGTLPQDIVENIEYCRIDGVGEYTMKVKMLPLTGIPHHLSIPVEILLV